MTGPLDHNQAALLDRTRLRRSATGVRVSGRWALSVLALAGADAASGVVRGLVHADPAARRRLPGLADELCALPGRAVDVVAGGAQPDPAALGRLARATAIGVHVRGLLAWQRGRAAGGGGSAGLAAAFATTDRAYVLALARLRRAAADDPEAVLTAVQELVTGAAATADLAARAAAVSRPTALGVPVAGLVRSQAAAAAGGILLAARVAAPRRRTAARSAAARPERIRRAPADPRTARPALSAQDRGRHLRVTGTVAGVEFVERPEAPYSRITLVPPGPPLLVPRRNVRRLGLTTAMGLWAAGEVKDLDGPVLEVEFEGPGQHRQDYVEDYLVDLARTAYNRWPGVLQLEWQLPDRSQPGGRNELTARVRFGEA